MDARRVNDEVSVAAQISVEEVAQLAEMGFRSIVCNRPDGESPGQPAFSEIEAAARSAGLEIAWQPIATGGLSDESGAEFGDIFDALPKPVLAFCKGGVRSIAVWALSQAKTRTSSEIIGEAAEAGFDLRGLAARLDAIRAAGS